VKSVDTEFTAFRSTFSSFFLADSCSLAAAAVGAEVTGLEAEELVDGASFTEPSIVAVLLCWATDANNKQRTIMYNI